MEITPGKGTSIVVFGLTFDEAVSVLGNADKTFLTEEGNKRVQFNKHLLELSFEPENENLLGWIEVHNPEATMFGHKLIGMNQKEVLEIVESNCNEKGELEDFGSMISVFFDKHWLELQFEFGLCRSVNLGVLYDENEQPIW